ncbi:hypothetical protein BGZ98_003515 [Dissophora globulifera]|nr:hypothetical protein BGZ98_003515 [Dissophora globulifera]
MSRPNRRMLALPGAQALAQENPSIRLRKKKDRFVFMAYNLLAQALVRRDMFPHASQKALRWKFRRQNLLQELLSCSPDIACLQEVDFWDDFYQPSLTKAGYETVYYRNVNKKHGCAIIWRKSRFEKVEQSTVEYDDIGQPTFMTGNIGLMVGLRPLSQRIENADPNADMVLSDDDEEGQDVDLEGRAASSKEESDLPGGILVATTHLFWRPDGSYERLRQASILLDKIKECNEKLQYTVLLGGDFNTTPRDAAYRAMTRNEMPPQQIPNLQQWLIDEVQRVQEAESAATAAAAPSSSTTVAACLNGEARDSQLTDAGIDQLTAQAEALNLGGTASSSHITTTTDGNEKDDEKTDKPYRAPPTGILLPKTVATAKTSEPLAFAEASTPESTLVNASDYLTSADPKLKHLAASASNGGSASEDAPVIAPLEAFTPPQNLLSAIETHPRCISIYGQYEILTKDNPAEVNILAEKITNAEESTATKAHDTHTHSEPLFTNFATWFKDTLDYIYLYEEPIPEHGARLVPLKLLEIPDKSFLGHGLPNESFSSDHLCLLVEFAILCR